jgi:hypothetical protein
LIATGSNQIWRNRIRLTPDLIRFGEIVSDWHRTWLDLPKSYLIGTGPDQLAKIVSDWHRTWSALPENCRRGMALLTHALKDYNFSAPCLSNRVT